MTTGRLTTNELDYMYIEGIVYMEFFHYLSSHIVCSSLSIKLSALLFLSCRWIHIQSTLQWWSNGGKKGVLGVAAKESV